LDPDDFGRDNPRFQGANFDRNLRLVERVQEIAAEKGVMPSQLALAWVLREGDDIVPIPGTRHITHLEENIRAIDVELADDDLARLEQAFPKGATAGDRYPDMSTVDV
jgi:aryl-alcohol dehydrogenase-like predicted oxidoreductase